LAHSPEQRVINRAKARRSHDHTASRVGDKTFNPASGCLSSSYFEPQKASKDQKGDVIMNRLSRSILLAAALVSGASAAMAAPVPDQSDEYGGYHPNSTQGQRAFWENQSRKSGD
jgi:hypothetical protein